VVAGTIWIWRVVPSAEAAAPTIAIIIAVVRMHRDGKDMEVLLCDAPKVDEIPGSAR
jgi:hypothetical protein